MKRALPVMLFLCFGLLTTACIPPAWLTEEADVLVVPSSIDGSGATDVSAAMAAFFRGVPDGSSVRLQPGATYRMEETLLFTKRHDLRIDGMGATIFATTPGDRVRANMRFVLSSNIMVSNLTIRGANPNAGLADEAQVLSKEGQHGIDVRSTTGFLLNQVTITDTYGDFVYLGRWSAGRWSTGAIITNNTFARSGRHAITLTAAENVLIENNNIDLIRFATFDLEAHHPGFGMKNVTIRNNIIGDGRGLLVASVGTGDRDNFVFENNQVNRTLDIRMSSEDGAQQSNWRIAGNVGATNAGNAMQAAMMFDHLDGLVVTGNYQSFDPKRSMVGVKVDTSCDVAVSGNTYPGAVAEVEQTGRC